MVIPRTVMLILAALLAVAEGVQQALHIGGYAHAAISCLIIMCAALGVRPATPIQLQKELPQWVVALIAVFIASVNVVQQAVPTMPTWVHIVIGVILVIGSALGLQVSTFPVSKGATKELARVAARSVQASDVGTPAVGGAGTSSDAPASPTGVSQSLPAPPGSTQAPPKL